MTDAAAIARDLAPLAQEIARHWSHHRVDGLWSLASIAKWCEVSERKARDIVATPGFPKPVRLPVDGKDYGHPRWFAEEVIKWWSKRRDA